MEAIETPQERAARHEREAEGGYYLLCDCPYCGGQKALDSAYHAAHCKRSDQSDCRHHGLSLCHCDCPGRPRGYLPASELQA